MSLNILNENNKFAHLFIGRRDRAFGADIIRRMDHIH